MKRVHRWWGAALRDLLFAVLLALLSLVSASALAQQSISAVPEQLMLRGDGPLVTTKH